MSELYQRYEAMRQENILLKAEIAKSKAELAAANEAWKVEYDRITLELTMVRAQFTQMKRDYGLT